MKKRFLAMALAGAMSISVLAGCGSDSASTGSADASADEYNVAVIVKLTDGHFTKVMAGAKAYAEEHEGVNVELLSPTSATAYDEQANMIETALGNDTYDAVVISPLQSETAATLVANTDKVIVSLDTDFNSDKKSAFVGTGNKDAAKGGGQAAVEAAKANGVENPTAVILTGVQGDETHDARRDGYKEGIEEAGGTVIEIQYCDAQADKAATAMEAVLQKYPDGIDIVCSTNDDMVMSASKIISDSGNAAYDNTVLCGFDGNQSAIEAIGEGITMDVVQQGYDMGYKAVEAAIKVLEGESVDSFIDSGSSIVDIENVEEYIATAKELGVWEA